MATSVKNKIRLGTLFLFLLILFLGGVGLYFLTNLKTDTRKILKDNYESLLYSHTMQQQIDSLGIKGDNALTAFEKALKQQEVNITEKGEREATGRLRTDFTRLKSGDSSKQVIQNVRTELQQVIGLNMAAIEQKNTNAQLTAENALTVIWLVAAIVIIIAFTFSFNFPNIVVGPIQELTAAIKEIANKNYSHRIHIGNKDEFGQLAEAFNNMAERLEYFENSNLNQLMFEKARAEAVINSLKDASIGIDKKDRILFANYQALNLLSVSASDIVGRSIGEIKATNDLFRFLLENSSSSPFKIIVDNKENYFTRETLEVDQGETHSRVIVLKNITSFKELDVAKTNFIATISHELKTPLASSDLSIKLLQDERIGKLSGEQVELVKNLKNDNNRMLKILSELLNMSQVETGKIELNIQHVNAEQIVDIAIATVINTANEKRIQLQKSIPPDLPEVKADPEKTAWVLNNFLTNAIKYGPEDSIIIITVSEKEKSLLFAVTDRGPGLPPEYLAKVFERYFKVPGNITKGTGLGLAISREFIEAQKGSISAVNNEDGGCIFSFSLPCS